MSIFLSLSPLSPLYFWIKNAFGVSGKVENKALEDFMGWRGRGRAEQRMG
jgi:hypothetical protein